jgi:hypothetical protein
VSQSIIASVDKAEMKLSERGHGALRVYRDFISPQQTTSTTVVDGDGEKCAERTRPWQID